MDVTTDVTADVTADVTTDVTDQRLIVMDIDCTIYSYTEFIHANWSSPRQSLEAFAGYARARSFPAVDRLWRSYESEIERRLLLLKERAAPRLVFVSAFPIEGPKRETFAKMGLEALSTFPASKLSWFPDKGRARFVFGDRLSDCRLAMRLGVPWAGLPFWHRAHRQSGAKFTQTFFESFDAIMTRTRYEL